jgi:hypothetical protein
LAKIAPDRAAGAGTGESVHGHHPGRRSHPLVETRRDVRLGIAVDHLIWAASVR